ncbi:urease accessory UreF family protein [Hyphomicrobium sp. CS1GBMeth3]|uniref:urease accessory protein UreF n=1 Tax=Hyphomicrobium sp. CS1GBMeth3 TaxID=1892845 RepID=UPI0009309A67|nr:urease accessory UreF family protein [Hyphomicrobium sp. CS1GBMeth3]
MIGGWSELLSALRYGDSFFPSGAIAFSWGLETLVADGIVRDAATAEAFLRGQTLRRWDTFDRPFVVAAMRARDACAYNLDRDVESLTLVREQREASARAGRSLLAVHERLGTPGAAEYQRAIRSKRAHGHVPVVQGLLFVRAGLSPGIGQAMSAYGVCVGTVSAAVRLGVLGAIDAQKVLSSVLPDIAVLLETSARDPQEAFAYVPQAEIAIMRHEEQSGRLFAS